jgi:type VI secretion system protein ImpL
MIYVATALAYLVYLVLAWFIGSLLHLQGRDLWILRGGLAVLGLAAAIVFLWYYLKLKKEKSSAAGGSQNSAEANSIDAVIREAEARLRTSNLGRSGTLDKLPTVLVLGDTNAAKTSSMVNSGLTVDLLAGQVYEGKNIVPTRSANFWYSRNTVFVEAATKAGTAGLTRLVKWLRPRKFHFLKRVHPARAAVVCFSCETFFEAGASEAIAASARRIRSALDEIARNLGINFPVYVLFTKVDRVPFFAEYTRNLNNEEASQVLGVTLPLQSGQEAGVFAEQETRRLNVAFNNLILSLADKRREFLAREHDSQKLAGAYEFPRELRKLRSGLVQLLVDLCKPSQLRSTPFLRGFYFSGVRAVVVNDAPQPMAGPTPTRASGFNLQTNATGIFDTGQSTMGLSAAPPPSIRAARKVPHWAFLTHFFNDVLLQDRVAMAATSASAKTDSLRRVLLLAGTALCLLFSLAFVISYAGNSALESELNSATRGLSQTPSVNPTVADLTQLDTLRQSLEKLSQYAREGAPWHLRWGLYIGDSLYPNARTLYFNRFHQLLFNSTQAGLVESLKRLPSQPGPGEDYGTAYDTLKAYLITTSNHDKSTSMFLSPVLMRQWMAGRNADANMAALAGKQFDFYSEELKSANPFKNENDGATIERSRRYLSQFAGTERVYQFMLAEASRKASGLSFNKQFPGSAEVLVDTKEVSGAYTKAGWTFMQDAIKNADRFFSGEQWVLGQQSGLGIDRSKLEQELKDRYNADFIAQWQQFVRAASVVRYANVKDAAAKLSKLSGNQSPLLALLCQVSLNTNVESAPIKTAFQPAQFVVPATCTEKYIAEGNTGYMNALVALNALIEQMANTPNSAETLGPQTAASAVQAKVVTRQLAGNFRIDPQTHLESAVQKLMEDPITYAESLVRNAGPAELNGKGKGLCTQFVELTNKYPFNSTSTREATLQDLNAVFQPQQGALWTFYEANLKNVLIRQGSQFAAKPDSPIALNPAFLNFWNNAAEFTDAVYPDNSGQPRLSYTLRSKLEGAENVTLTIDGQPVASSKENAPPHAFVWSGNPNSEVKLTGGSGLAYNGLWAPFKFFGDADRWTKVGTVYTVEWNLRLGRATPLALRFDLDMGKAAPVFQKNYLSSLKCVSEIAR